MCFPLAWDGEREGRSERGGERTSEKDPSSSLNEKTCNICPHYFDTECHS